MMVEKMDDGMKKAVKAKLAAAGIDLDEIESQYDEETKKANATVKSGLIEAGIDPELFMMGALLGMSEMPPEALAKIDAAVRRERK
jgi:hypothetical protein